MKCPVLSAPTARTAFTEPFAEVDCLKEECAWWNKEADNCSIQGIYAVAEVAQYFLKDIRDKMPHAGQFTR